MRVGVAYVDVRVNMAQYKTDLLKLETLASQAATSVNSRLSKIGVGYSEMGKGASAAATSGDKVASSVSKQRKGLIGLLPHVALVTASYMAMRTAWRGFISGLGAGVEFEQKMSAVKAISRATADEFIRLGNAAREMAVKTVFTSTEAADALRYLSMAGFSVQESMDSLQGVLNLALIGELELGRATDIATDTLRAFGLEASEINRVTDVMVSTITRSNTNIEMMGQAMKFAAPVAKSLGYNIEQISAMIGVLSQSGVKAGIAGRNIQQALVRSADAAKKLGLEIGSNLIDVVKAYNIEQEKLEKRIGAVGAREAIASQIRKDYGLIALKSILILKDNIDTYEKLYEAANKSAGETQRAADIMQDNVDSAWKLVKSAISDLSVEIFYNYKEGLKDFLLETARWFRENRERISDVADVIIAGMSKTGEALASFGRGLSSVISELYKLASLQEGLPESIVGAGGIGLIAAIVGRSSTIGLITAGLVLLNDEMKKFTSESERQAANVLQSGGSVEDILKAAYGFKGEVKTFKVPGVTDPIENLRNEIDKLADTSIYAKSDFTSFLDSISTEELVKREAAKAFIELPSEVKKAYSDTLALERYKEKIDGMFSSMSDIAKIDDPTKKAIQAAKNALIAEYKKASKEKEKLSKKEFEFDYKNAIEEADKLRKIKEISNEDAIAIARKNAQTEKKLEADKAKAIIDLNDRITKKFIKGSAEWLDARAKDIEAEKDKYRKLKIDEDLINKAFAQEERELIRQRLVYQGNFYDGAVAYLDELSQQITSWGQVGYAVMKDFAEKSSSALSDTLFGVITGELDNLSDIWDSVWKSMLKTFLDVVSQMAVRWALLEFGGLFGPSGTNYVSGLLGLANASTAGSGGGAGNIGLLSSVGSKASSLFGGGSAAVGAQGTGAAASTYGGGAGLGSYVAGLEAPISTAPTAGAGAGTISIGGYTGTALGATGVGIGAAAFLAGTYKFWSEWGQKFSPAALEWVQAWLNNDPAVPGFEGAPPGSGGYGYQSLITGPDIFKQWLADMLWGPTQYDDNAVQKDTGALADLANSIYNRSIGVSDLRNETDIVKKLVNYWQDPTAHQMGGILRSADMLKLGKGEPFFRGLPGEGVVSHRGMKALEDLNLGNTGGEVHVHLYIDGREIGYTVADQTKKLPELITAIRKVAR